MYKEDYRETITRSDIVNFLKKEMTQGVVFVILLLTLLFVIPCLILIVLIKNTLFIAVATIIIALALFIIGCAVSRAAHVSHIVNRGLFSVTEDTLISVNERLYSKKIRRSLSSLPREHHDYVFIFESGKEFTVTDPIPRDTTRLEFSVKHSSKGDRFYVVTLNKKPDEIVLIYSSVIFSYKG